MPKSKITWYKSKTNQILNEVRKVSQSEIATEINESQQTVSYRLRNVYPEFLEDWIRILNLIGFEIVRKEGE